MWKHVIVAALNSAISKQMNTNSSVVHLPALPAASTSLSLCSLGNVQASHVFISFCGAGICSHQLIKTGLPQSTLDSWSCSYLFLFHSTLAQLVLFTGRRPLSSLENPLVLWACFSTSQVLAICLSAFFIFYTSWGKYQSHCWFQIPHRFILTCTSTLKCLRLDILVFQGNTTWITRVVIFLKGSPLKSECLSERCCHSPRSTGLCT